MLTGHRPRALARICTCLLVAVFGVTAASTSASNSATDDPARLTVERGKFVVDGQQMTLVGINASGAASTLALGSPCGYPDLDLDQMFAALPEHALVRVWFTQKMATRKGPNERVWDGIDAVVAAAERAATKPLLLATLATSAGDCDGGQWRDRAWFERGWQTGPEPYVPNAYGTWVDEIVTRYADRDVVAIWEPVNEPDPSTCLPGYNGSGCFGHTRCDEGAALVLSSFLNTVGKRIHDLDPGGLVSTGGGGWCGWGTVADRIRIEGTPNVDVLSIHDYHNDTDPLPWGVEETARRADWLGKPFIVGELGIGAGEDTGRTPEQRAELLVDKVEAQADAGASAVLPWVYGDSSASCGWCLGPEDPFLALARAQPLVEPAPEAPPPVVPEAPSSVLLPATAAALIASFAVILRRWLF